MPIYEYICCRCNNKFSLLQSVKAADQDAKCPECGTWAKKTVSAFSCTSSSDHGVSGGASFTGGG